MAVTTTIPWNDGSGDNIYVSAPSQTGSQTVTVTSDANTGAARSKVVTFATGNITRQLTVNQDAGSGGRLPAGYTEYDYLSSPGNVTLRTTVYGAATWYLTAQCSSPSSGSQIVVGYTSNGGCWAGQASSKWSLGGGAHTTISSGTKSDMVAQIESPTTYLTVGGETVQRNMNVGLGYGYLFGLGSYKFNGKIFGDSVAKQNGAEVFHGIPCTNQNNVAGYYDTISRSFIAPESGTLTAGNE